MSIKNHQASSYADHKTSLNKFQTVGILHSASSALCNNGTISRKAPHIGKTTLFGKRYKNDL